MGYITPLDLGNAKQDARTIEKFNNDPLGKENISRLGQNVSNLATIKAQALEAAAGAANLQTYLTKADLLADTGREPPARGQVTADPVDANNGFYDWDGTAWTWSKIQPASLVEVEMVRGQIVELAGEAARAVGVGPYGRKLVIADATGQELLATSSKGLEIELGDAPMAQLAPTIEQAEKAPQAEQIGPYGYPVLYVDQTGQIVGGDGGQVVGQRLNVVFISTTGDDANAGTIDSPVQSEVRALQLIGGRGAVVYRGGDYINRSIPLAAAERVEFYAHRDERVRFMNGYPLTLTAHPTDAGIYQASIDHARRPGRYVWEHETPEGLIPDDERHPFNQGRTHRLPSTRLHPVSTYEELQNAEAAAWWYDGAGTLYLRGTAGVDPLAKIYYVPDSRYPMCAGATGWQRPSLFGIEVWYGYGIDLSSVALGEVEDCYVLGSRNRGLVRDRARTRECRVEVAGADQDGANGHTYAADQRSTFSASDSYYHDNGDDGASDHENCAGSYDNVVFEYNGGRSIAVAYGARVTASNVLSRKAGRYGAVTGKTEGFCVLGAVPDPVYGKETQLILRNAVSIDDSIAFSANAADSVLIGYDVKAIRAGVVARASTAGARVTLHDPREQGSTTLKQGAGVQIINTNSFE